MLSRLKLLLLTALVGVGPRLALAAEDYQPYSPKAETEQVSAPLFVIIAYSLIWLVLIGFLVSVWRRQRRVEQELDLLRRQLEGGGS